MAKTTLSSISSVANLVSAFIAQLVIDGWTQVGSTGIHQSDSDAAGRTLYIEPFVDSLGQFMIKAAPLLNGAGDDFPTEARLSTTLGCNFSSGDWELYSTSQSFFLVRGTTNNSQRVWGGHYHGALCQFPLRMSRRG